MAENPSSTLGAHFDAFVTAQIDSGRYADAADVIRSELRRLEERERTRDALRHALIAGEQSGVAGPLDIDRINRRGRDATGRTQA